MLPAPSPIPLIEPRRLFPLLRQRLQRRRRRVRISLAELAPQLRPACS